MYDVALEFGNRCSNGKEMVRIGSKSTEHTENNYSLHLNREPYMDCPILSIKILLISCYSLVTVVAVGDRFKVTIDHRLIIGKLNLLVIDFTIELLTVHTVCFIQRT